MSFDVTIKTTLQVKGEEIQTIASRTFTGLADMQDQTFKVKSRIDTIFLPNQVYTLHEWQILILTSDQPVNVELSIANGDELDSFALASDTAFVLGSREAYTNHSPEDIFAGDLDVIGMIRVQELNNVEATVRLRLYGTGFEI